MRFSAFHPEMRTFFDSLWACVVIVNQDNQVVYMNDVAKKTLDPAESFLPYLSYSGDSQSHEDYPKSLRFNLHDRFFSGTTSVFSSDEDHQLLIHLFEEYTKRKKMETELSHLKKTLDQATFGWAVVDPQGTIMECNDYMAHVHGYLPKEIIGQHFQIMHTSQQFEEVQKSLQELLASAVIKSRVICHQHRSGYTFPMLMNGIVFFDESGQPEWIGTTAIDLQDVTEKETALKKSEDQYRTLFETMAQGVVYQDRSGQIIDANPSAERILGLSLDQMQGRLSIDPRWKAMHPDGSEFPGQDHPAMVALRTGQAVHNEIMGVFNPKTDKTTWININARPQFIEGEDTPYQVYTTFEDITLRIEAEQSLLEAKKVAEAASEAKSHFLSMMSHELRTPLNAVIGFSEMLMAHETSSGNEVQQEYIQHIVQSGHILLEIIGNILDFSKIEAGKIELFEERTDLIALCEKMIVVHQPAAQKKGIQLRLHIEESVPRWVMLDSVRVQQVLNNLLNNAIKFTESGYVELHVKFEEKQNDGRVLVYFAVEDTGIGISTEQQSKLFKAFTQADPSTTRKYGGTGLGLVISNKLLQLMDSALKLKSSVGQGSRFSFQLPLHLSEDPEKEQTDQTSDATPHPVSIWKKAIKVLIAEDNPVNMKLIKLMLRKHLPSATIIEASHGGDAVIQYQEKLPELILMDVHMPQMDGHEATRAIRNEQSDRNPIIVGLSAATEKAEIDRCFESGMDDFLPKPVIKEQLIGMLIRWFPDLEK